MGSPWQPAPSCCYPSPTGLSLIICVNEEIEPEVSDGLRASPPPLAYLVKGSNHGTGGSLKDVEDCLEGEPFWVLSGDLLLGTGLTRMLDFHRTRGAMATVGSLRVDTASWEMERVEFDAEQRVKAIHRLHPLQEKRSTLRPAGLYLFEPEILQVIPGGGYFDLKEQLFFTLYQQGGLTVPWEIPGYCRTITSIGEYLFANQDVLLGRVNLPELPGAPELSDAAAPKISASAKFYGSMEMGRGSQVGDDTLILGPTAIGSHCEIEAGAVISECVILGNSRIGRGSYLNRCVLCEGAIIGEGTILHEAAIMKRTSEMKEEAIFSLRQHSPRENGTLIHRLEWQTPVSSHYQKVKRLVDIIIAVTGLIILSPLMLLIAVAVKLDSSGRVFFGQERCGKNGRRFTMYKFRTMVDNAEDLKRKLTPLNEVDGPMFKISRDPRITRMGKVLRDTNLDELPQLWNVLKGDMSLVGPRPLSMEEMSLNPRWRDARLSVPPGITGTWQVEAHSKTQFRDWIHHDLDYVKKTSLWFDLKIKVKTALKMVDDLIRLVIKKVSKNHLPSILLVFLAVAVLA
jgi:lipopolysaccharide/colanic/teichoic acid biosynthesis glycosyltransferase/NDP-sugar pyrophosphorylase family protein